MIQFVKEKLVPILVALVIGAAVGYFATPSKVVTKTEIKEVIKEVEKKVESSEKNKKNDKVYVKVETVLPDGTRKIETKIVDKGTVSVSTESDTTKSTDTNRDTKTEKTVERDHESLLLYVSGGVKIDNWAGGPEIGGGVQKRVLGPFWLGLYGTSQLRAGATIGVSF